VTVHIPQELEPFVQSVIDRGSFQTEAEVVAEALRLYRDRERRVEALRAQLQPSLDRLDAGEGIDMDEASLDAFFDDVKRRGRARSESGRDAG
jgi:putative addiction module CopG family antidote